MKCHGFWLDDYQVLVIINNFSNHANDIISHDIGCLGDWCIGKCDNCLYHHQVVRLVTVADRLIRTADKLAEIADKLIKLLTGQIKLLIKQLIVV